MLGMVLEAAAGEVKERDRRGNWATVMERMNFLHPYIHRSGCIRRNCHISSTVSIVSPPVR